MQKISGWEQCRICQLRISLYGKSLHLKEDCNEHTSKRATVSLKSSNTLVASINSHTISVACGWCLSALCNMSTFFSATLRLLCMVLLWPAVNLQRLQRWIECKIHIGCTYCQYSSCNIDEDTRSHEVAGICLSKTASALTFDADENLQSTFASLSTCRLRCAIKDF